MTILFTSSSIIINKPGVLLSSCVLHSSTRNGDKAPWFLDKGWYYIFSCKSPTGIERTHTNWINTVVLVHYHFQCDGMKLYLVLFTGWSSFSTLRRKLYWFTRMLFSKYSYCRISKSLYFSSSWSGLRM